VTKSFGEGEARRTAIDHVAFVAHFGEMVFIWALLAAARLRS